jgi:uncharacterized protein (TIGR00251 family)
MMLGMAANYLTTNEAGICLAVKLLPRAARNEIGPALGNEIKIKVTAPPVEGAANEALIRFLAEMLGCPRSAVQIVRGQTSRHKTVAIAGLGAAEALARLKL